MIHFQNNSKKHSTNLITINDLFLAEVHLGHISKDWNPKMQSYIYATLGQKHLIDLEQTLPLLRRAMSFLRKVSIHNGQILFVGTRSSEIAQITKITAKITNQSYIATRWVHGTLSNWNTVSKSIKELNEFEKRLDQLKETWFIRKGKSTFPSVSELLSSSFSPSIRRRYKRLKYLFDGVRKLESLPSVIVILDDLNNHRAIVEEAKRQNVAVIGILDTNSDPDGVHYPIPGNDDSLKALHLYAKCLAEACIEGENLRISS